MRTQDLDASDLDENTDDVETGKESGTKTVGDGQFKGEDDTTSEAPPNGDHGFGSTWVPKKKASEPAPASHGVSALPSQEKENEQPCLNFSSGE